MRKRWLVALAAAAVVIGLVAVNRHEILRFVIEKSAGLASGYTVVLADQKIGSDGIRLLDVHVSHGEYPLLDAKELYVHYSLRDLLPGSTHRYGLTGISITDAKLTVVKFKDGTYNFIIPSGGASGPAIPGSGNPVPIRFGLTMHDAALELREPQAYEVSAKSVTVHDFNVDATIDSATRT